MGKLPLFIKGKSGGMHFESQKKISSVLVLYVYFLFITILFITLGLRLFQLTIVKGEYYSRASEQNRIRELIIEPKRGIIRDRKGLILANNVAADTKKNLERLTSHRIYHSPDVIAPVVGYRQKADQEDFSQDSCINKLRIGDKVGKKGIEKIYECELRGKYGKKLIEVDARGQYLRTISLLPPQDGKTIQLALDLALQTKVYELVKGKNAAVVATKPDTGEILVLVSSPTFNPQAFEDENAKTVSSYLSARDKPLFNKSTEGTYPPGSIFKIILATGALEEKKITDRTLIEDTGTLKAGPLSFGNWYFLQYGKTDGMVDVVKAIRRSNDIFFYKVGDLLTPNKIKKWADIFGYGSKTGIGLEEAEGIIPSEFWKQEMFNDRWYLGDTYNLSIGQGYLLVTPLQMNQATAVFANGGYLCKPILTRASNFPASPAGRQLPTSNCKKLPISEKTLSLVRQGMKEACTTGGTGWPFFDFKVQSSELIVDSKKPRTINSEPSTMNIQVGCKTGTAESQSAAPTGSDLEVAPPHAWFTVFAPYDKPEIVLTVLVENAGQGSDVAAPIAKEILRAYFERSE